MGMSLGEVKQTIATLKADLAAVPTVGLLEEKTRSIKADIKNWEALCGVLIREQVCMSEKMPE